MATTKKAGISNFKRGDTRKYRIVFTDKLTGLPISVHGGKLFITFKINKSDLDEDAVIAVDIDTVELDPLIPTGVIIATLTDVDTEVPIGKYYYDFQFVSPTGEVTTIIPEEDMVDTVKILEDITRRKV
jgi:hypothetical protein